MTIENDAENETIDHRPRSRLNGDGLKYTKYKMCLCIKMIIYFKQHLSIHIHNCQTELNWNMLIDIITYGRSLTFQKNFFYLLQW